MEYKGKGEHMKNIITILILIPLLGMGQATPQTTVCIGCGYKTSSHKDLDKHDCSPKEEEPRSISTMTIDIASAHTLSATSTWTVTDPKDTVAKITDPKEEYRYLIEYRIFHPAEKVPSYSWSGGTGGFNGYTKPAYWEYSSKIFKTLDDLKAWINTSNRYWHTEHDIYIQETSVVGIYDLKSAKKLSYSLKTEHKFKPRKVVIEKEEWTDKWYEIK